jgi:hypothetical protein
MLVDKEGRERERERERERDRKIETFDVGTSMVSSIRRETTTRHI